MRVVESLKMLYVFSKLGLVLTETPEKVLPCVLSYEPGPGTSFNTESYFS